MEISTVNLTKESYFSLIGVPILAVLPSNISPYVQVHESRKALVSSYFLLFDISQHICTAHTWSYPSKSSL